MLIQLPEELQAAIAKIVGTFNQSELTKASTLLSTNYRQGHSLLSKSQRMAYLVTRLPATFAAVLAVLAKIPPSLLASMTSLLDLGAGPGTVMWAAAQQLTALKKITCVERDTDWIMLGSAMAVSSSSKSLREATWQQADLKNFQELPCHSLVCFSYSLGELSQEERKATLQRAWEASSSLLIVIEPGSSRGFATILAARQWLLEQRGHLLAPCPHPLPCPMTAGNWCHFSQRTSRSSLHRIAKNASLTYEEEKYSYIIASKTPLATAPSRIVHSPAKYPGRVLLNLCQEGQLVRKTISKRDKPLYRQARKVEWGDCWPPTPSTSTKELKDLHGDHSECSQE